MDPARRFALSSVASCLLISISATAMAGSTNGDVKECVGHSNFGLPITVEKQTPGDDDAPADVRVTVDAPSGNKTYDLKNVIVDSYPQRYIRAAEDHLFALHQAFDSPSRKILRRHDVDGGLKVLLSGSLYIRSISEDGELLVVEKLASGPAIDFDLRILLMTRDGKVLKTIDTAFVIENSNSSGWTGYGTVYGWGGEHIYLGIHETAWVPGFIYLNAKSLKTKVFDLDTSLVDFKLNPCSGLVAFLDRPHFYTYDEIEQYEIDNPGWTVRLFVMNLWTKRQVEVMNSTERAFDFDWVDAHTLSFEDKSVGKTLQQDFSDLSQPVSTPE